MRPHTAAAHLAGDHRPELQRLAVLRPFLQLEKAQLQEYCQAEGVDWIEDPSNRDQSFARVRNRFTLSSGMPALSLLADLLTLRNVPGA